MSYRCKYCGKEFNNIHALAGHIRMSHAKRKRRKQKHSNIYSSNVYTQHSSASSTSSASSALLNKEKIVIEGENHKIIIYCSKRVADVIRKHNLGYLRALWVAKVLKDLGLCDYQLLDLKDDYLYWYNRLKRIASTLSK